MKIITLNLNGIRSASRKSFYDWLPLQKADFVCLQELKAHEVDLDDQMKAPKEYFHVTLLKYWVVVKDLIQ